MSKRRKLKVVSVLICLIMVMNSLSVYASQADSPDIPDGSFEGENYDQDDWDYEGEHSSTDDMSVTAFDLSDGIPEEGIVEEGPVEAFVAPEDADDTETIITSENEVTAQEELADTDYVLDDLDHADEEAEEETAVPFARAFAAAAVSNAYDVALAGTNGSFTVKKTYSSFDAAKAAMQDYSASASDTLEKNSYVVRYNKRVVAMINGMAIVTSTQGGTLTFSNMYGGSYPYVANNYTMYYYGTDNLNTVNVGISGMTGSTSYKNVLLIPYAFISGRATGNFASTNIYERDYYTSNSNGELVHYITTLTDPNTGTHYESGEKTTGASVIIDRAPGWMSQGVAYYSMDGVNFYQDQELTSLAGTYYPYYKYLSFHSESNYTASELNSFLSYYVSSYGGGKTSILTNNGSAFTDAQKNYGINALLELAFACHESAYGTSNYAVTRNNLFGISATDENPDNASYYASVTSCVDYHARRLLKQAYLDALSDFRYFGANIGSKAVGVNVKYASDPFHGEKVSGWAYRIDSYLGGKDYNTDVIGVSNTASVPVYASASAAKTLYSLSNKGGALSGLPVMVLGQSGDYYKVQSDMPIEGGTAICTGTYSYSHVGYIQKSAVTLVRNSDNLTETPKQTETQSETKQTETKQTESETQLQTKESEKQSEKQTDKQTEPETQPQTKESEKQTDKQTESETQPQTKESEKQSEKQTEKESQTKESEKQSEKQTEKESQTKESDKQSEKQTDKESAPNNNGTTAPLPDSNAKESNKADGSTPEESSPETSPETSAETKKSDSKETNSTVSETQAASYEASTLDRSGIKDLIAENKTKDIIIHSGQVSFIFKKGTMTLEAIDGMEIFAFDTETVADYTSISSSKQLFKEEEFALLINFDYSGPLPGTAQIRVKAGTQHAGETLYYYRINDDYLTLVDSAVVGSDGFIIVEQDRCSDYVFLNTQVGSVSAKNTSTSTSEVTPNTGDSTSVYLIFAALLLSAGALLITIFKKKYD